MNYQILIKGGTVVDGTLDGAKKADVRIANGVITEVGANLSSLPRERLFDATDCLVTPGFIETHNHYDAPMWWMPNLEPMSSYGITTSINGNCGFSPAPISDDPEARLEMIKIFTFFEDIPIQPFIDKLPWDWRTWSEYRASLEKNLKFPVNFAAYCGHIAIRLAVMGLEAWDRAATPDEIRKMCALLEDALDAGALGLSSNLLDYDNKGRPIPTRMADDAEFEALFDVLAKYPGKTAEIIVGVFQRFTGAEDMKRLEKMAGPRGIRLMWAGIPTLQMQMGRGVDDLITEHERYKSEGLDFFTAFHHVAPVTAINFNSSLTFAQSNILVWAELAAAKTDEEKLAFIEDPNWRDRARASWAEGYPQSPLRKPDGLMLMDSQSGCGPLGISLGDYMRQKGIDNESDAMAEWLIDNGFDSTLITNFSNRSEEQIIGLFRDPKALGNVSDSGAHAQMLCGIGDHIHLLTHYVRDQKSLTIEEGIHNLTGKLANFFGLKGRGEIKVGNAADVVVFNLDEVERRPMLKQFDVPSEGRTLTWRYTRDPAPMRLTLVNGVATFDNNRFTGKTPGEVVSTPMMEYAQAAE
jgi:N-acyl-D-amino-acid deacylase